MKRILAVMLSLLFVAALLPSASKAETSGNIGDNLTWSFDESTGVLTITGSGKMNSFYSAPWYDFAAQIKEVRLPNGLTNISTGAFMDCTSLTAVTIPSTVLSLGGGVFSGCTSLKNVSLPASLYYLGTDVFYNTAFWNAQANGLVYLNHVLLGYKGSCPKTVNVKNGIKVIADGAFSELTLDKVVLPETLLVIGSGAFTYNRIGSINFPSSLTMIGSWAFEGTTLGISRLVIPPKTRLGESVFYCCNGMNELIILNPSYRSYLNPEYPSSGMFAETSCIKSITMPANSDVQNEDFYMAVGLEKLRLTKGNGRVNSSLMKNMYDDWYTYVANDFPLSVAVTLDDGITTIGTEAFSTSAFQSISLPASLTKIEANALAGASKLTDVYYRGTQAQRDAKLPASAIAGGNNPLLNATWHYSSDVTVGFNASDVKFKGATAYVIANGTAQTPRVTVTDNTTGRELANTKFDVEYLENVDPGTAYAVVTLKNGYSGSFRVPFKIYLPATSSTTVANVFGGIKLTWKAVAGASGYVVYRRAWNLVDNGWTTFERWNNTTGTTWTDTNVYAGTRYQYGIKAYFTKRLDPVSCTYLGGNIGDNYNLGEVGPLKTTVRITTRKLTSVTAGSKQMTVKWEGSSVFTGYQIQYATDSAFTKNAVALKISNPKTVQYTVKSLKSGTTYYVRLRSYHEFNGMTYFGEWSEVKSCKVK